MLFDVLGYQSGCVSEEVGRRLRTTNRATPSNSPPVQDDPCSGPAPLPHVSDASHIHTRRPLPSGHACAFAVACPPARGERLPPPPPCSPLWPCFLHLLNSGPPNSKGRAQDSTPIPLVRRRCGSRVAIGPAAARAPVAAIPGASVRAVRCRPRRRASAGASSLIVSISRSRMGV